LGIDTIGQLAQAPAPLLQEHFGRTYAAWLMRVAQGEDDRPVETFREPKSVGRETTFERDLHVGRDRAELSGVLMRLCERVSEDLRRKQCKGRTIGVKLRFEDFDTVTRDHSLPEATDEPARILEAARQCLKRIPMRGRIRLLGVRAAKLEPAQPDAQLSIFP
jgi:DNA polymerase-4